MWNDSIFNQFENFVGIFYGESFYWGDIINGTIVSMLLFAIFTLSAIIAMIVNGTASAEIKMGKSLKRIKGFAARFGVIQKGNFVHFNKICLSKMPASAKKSCIRFLFNPSTQNQAEFKRSLARTADRSCTNAFIGYIVVFGLGAIMAIVTLGLETFYLEGNNLFLAISLFYGTTMLIAMALQMYFIGNKYKNVDIQIYTEVVSRFISEQDTMKIVQKAENKAKEGVVDSIDELRRIVYGLIESGASKQLLTMFRDGLVSVAANNYNGVADQLRIENIVSRINSYIA